jgi:phosphate transport system substrate-binding protein
MASTYEIGGRQMKKGYYGTSVLIAVVAVFALALAAAATAKTSAPQVSGQISADGSSTVGPYVQAAAERFERANRGAKVVVGISGTGGGFERFCKDEIDLSNASRPIKLTEAAKCQQNGVQYIQFLIANDGLSVVINKNATWIDCITPEELKRIWDRGSKVDNWNDVRPSFPDVPMKLFGPGTDSGTFDFFTEKINGRSRQSRTDYSASEDDNVTVRGVAGERGGMGYFGLSYYIENKSRLKLLKIHNGTRCVAPSIASVQARTYRPLSRPLYVYAKKSSFKQKAVVRAFTKFMIVNEASLARTARFVPLTKPQLAKAKRQYNNAIKGL